MSTIDSDNFVDQNAATAFICAICHHVPLEPKVHGQMYRWGEPFHQCSLVFCVPCVTRYIGLNRNDWGGYVPCPQNCGGSMVRSDGAPHLDSPPPDTMRQLNNLLVNCYHDDCDEQVYFSTYGTHVNHCRFHPNRWCSICSVVKDNNHNCKQYIQSLREEIENLKGVINDQNKGPGQISDEDNSSPSSSSSQVKLSTTSNHLNVVHSYGTGAKLNVFVNDQVKSYDNVPLETLGKTFRSRLEREINQPVGQLFMFTHCEIINNKSLRQCNVKHRPTNIVALPPNAPVVSGQELKINIIGPGKIV